MKRAKEEESICHSKQRFPTSEIAIAVAHEFLVVEKVRNEVYFCPVCKGYHLTTGSKTPYVRHMKALKKKGKASNFNYHKLKPKKRIDLIKYGRGED